MARDQRIYKGDTAILEAALYDENDGVTPLPAISVNWSARKPDGSIINGSTGSIDQAEVTLAMGDTSLPGPYTVQISFHLQDGSTRSVPQTFEVIDPLETTNQSATDIDKAVDLTWMKLEDVFDSELGGPHLRDRSKNSFDREKIKRLLPDALYYINNFYQPSTGYTEVDFPWAQHSPLVSQSLLVETIRHMMRSYTEQYTPVAPNVQYLDRRDYLNRWQMILQIEQQRLESMMDLFKRDLMGFGQTSGLIGGYANFGMRSPRYMRSRYPYVYRG